MTPVVLFAYARPDHLERVLGCLRENGVPRIVAFADGARGDEDRARVERVRDILRRVDWCALDLRMRPGNLGLGRNVIDGIAEVVRMHDRFLVWEDDLICVPGAYDWLCAALDHYAAEPGVFSVAGWTHPRVRPDGIGDGPYLDGRAECWVWGAYARSWSGMEEPIGRKLAAIRAKGIRIDAYGADLPRMAAECGRRNTWAARWLCHHLQHGGLCVRPPWSLVEHIGFDAAATNAGGATEWINPPLRPAPPRPVTWPPPSEHPDCGKLWRRAVPGLAGRIRRKIGRWATGT